MMLKVSEVALRLQVSRTCVYQLVEKKKLVSHRIGLGRGAIRILEEDLASFVSASRVDSKERASVPLQSVPLKHLTQ